MGYLDNVIITPNADWVPQYPLVDEEVGIIKREDGCWGGNEYSRWPQFHSITSFHHACIPFDYEEMSRNTVTSLEKASSDGITNIALYDPIQSRDFTCDTEEKLGQIHEGIIEQLDVSLTRIQAKVQSIGQQRSREGSDYGAENIYKRCKASGRAALDRLHLLSLTWRETLLTVCEVQRAILELQGLHIYLETVMDRVSSNNNYQDKILPVRGAFTTDASVVHNLFRVGIPVWFITRAKIIRGKIYNVKSCTPWKTFLSDKVPQYGNRIKQEGIVFNLDDPMRDYKQTHFMGEGLITQLLERMYGLQNETFKVQASTLLSTTSTKHVASSITKPAPLARQNVSGRKCKGELRVNYARILYIPNGVDGRPDLPPYNKKVMDILTRISTIIEGDNDDQPSLYPLPPPFLLAHANAKRSADMYLNYIRIRPILLSILAKGNTFDQSTWRRLREWRHIIHGDYRGSIPLPRKTTSTVVERLYDLMPSSSINSPKRKRDDMIDNPSAKRQRNVNNFRMKDSMRVEYQIELGPFDRSKEQYWLGKPVLADTINRDKQLRVQVQWELSEILFRYELHALDEALLPRSGMTKAECIKRSHQLSSIYSSNPDGIAIVLPDLTKPIHEYWGENPDDRAVQALFSVLRDWPDYPHGESIPNFHSLVSFYIQTFAEYFRRVPTMHCNVPSSLQC